VSNRLIVRGAATVLGIGALAAGGVVVARIRQRPYKPGTWLDLGGFVGRIEEVRPREYIVSYGPLNTMIPMSHEDARGRRISA
jgi:hypothetical protein